MTALRMYTIVVATNLAFVSLVLVVFAVRNDVLKKLLSN